MAPRTTAPKAQILVVDDEALIRETLAEYLTQEGFHVCACADGEEALAVASDRPFDVALCDVQLPGMDGIELLNHVRRTKPGVPVIVLTAFGTVQTAVEEMKAGDITGFANAGSFFEQPERNGRRYLEQSFHSVRWNDLGCIQ